MLRDVHAHPEIEVFYFEICFKDGVELPSTMDEGSSALKFIGETE